MTRLLSPQYGLSCDHSCGGVPQVCDNGCQGGRIDLHLNYVNSNGLRGESCFPYLGDDTIPCPAAGSACSSNGTSGATNTLFYGTGGCFSLKTIADAQREILSNGPIVGGIDIYPDFETYTGGVYVVGQNQTSVGSHAIRVLGWGTDTGVNYWLVGNSWSQLWGEHGYVRIRRGTNEAGIEAFLMATMADPTRIPANEPAVAWATGCNDCKTPKAPSIWPASIAAWGLSDIAVAIIFGVIFSVVVSILGAFLYFCVCKSSGKKQSQDLNMIALT